MEKIICGFVLPMLLLSGTCFNPYVVVSSLDIYIDYDEFCAILPLQLCIQQTALFVVA